MDELNTVENIDLESILTRVVLLTIEEIVCLDHQ